MIDPSLVAQRNVAHNSGIPWVFRIHALFQQVGPNLELMGPTVSR